MLSFNQYLQKTNTPQNMITAINPLPYLFIAATAFGVVMHDTQVDLATSVAIMTPMHSTSYAADSIKSSDHTHVERVSMSNQGSSTHAENVPKTQPRNDHNKYAQAKKHAASGDGNGLWPSV